MHIPTDKTNFHKTIAIFGSSDVTEDEEAYHEAELLGRLLAEKGYAICNGGYGGVMEASSKGAKRANGKTIGITTCDINVRPPNSYNDAVIKTEKFMHRVEKLIDSSDGFVVVKGGVGTLCELAIAWDLNLLKVTDKPIILIGDFWNDVLKSFQKNIMINGEHLKYLNVVNTPYEAVKALDYLLNQKQMPQ